MGINNLLQFLRQYSKEVSLRDFSGKTAAVDASCWLHKDLYVSLSQSGTRERTTEIITKYLQLLSESGVKPLLVFDGRKLPAKADENSRRQREREERKLRAAATGDGGGANRLLGEAASITFDDVSKYIELCVKHNVEYVVSPYEADAQLAYLMKEGFVDLIITEDSDLIAYGCEQVLTKLSFDGKGEMFTFSDILQNLDMDKNQFQDACIASGCDYLKNLRGMGVHRAFSYTKESVLLEELLRKGANEEYFSKFAIAKKVFAHQTIFNLIEGKTMPLSVWDQIPSPDLQHICGTFLSKQDAKELAAGNIDFESGRKVNSFPFTQIQKTVPSQPPHLKDCVCHNQDTNVADLEVEIINIVKDKIEQWNIPCFPVMKLDFKAAKVRIKTRPENEVLISNDVDISEGHAISTSYCTVSISQQKWLVLWKIVQLLTDTNKDNSGDRNDFTDDDEETLNTLHTLPFKVMGTCYSTARQTALENAYECLYNYNREVLVRLIPEPENEHDPNAIAVHIMSLTDEYDKVGYIPKELTSYVHPCLQHPEFKASVKAIRFRTSL